MCAILSSQLLYPTAAFRSGSSGIDSLPLFSAYLILINPFTTLTLPIFHSQSNSEHNKLSREHG